jgi:precorrin-2/cobalt-factor-2 C20-methyltransferase
MTGCLYGIGVGPGDPELLTLKAARIRRAADRIYCPASARHEESFAARIIAPLELPPTKIRPVSLCMSRERQAVRQVYQEVAAEIAQELRQHRSVAWITEGDPLLYSTFLHVRAEVQHVAPEARIEIVPGVTSLQAAAARAGVPIAHLDEQVAIVPAAYGIEHLPALLDQFATVFLFKVHAYLEALHQQLAAITRPVQVYYLENVGTTQERLVTDLNSLRGQRLPYFSLVIIRREDDR